MSELLEIKHVLKGGYILGKIEKSNRIPPLYSTVGFKNSKSGSKNEFGRVVDIIGSTKAPYALVKLESKDKKEVGKLHGRKKGRVY